MRTCSVDYCGKKVKSLGLCIMHYTRLTRWGRLERSFEDKINDSYKVNDNGCWILNRGLNKDGYSYMMHKGERVRVHKYMYELKYGSIPKALVCDHLCRVRNCVNPDHIEVVTNRENIIRGVNARKTAALKGYKLEGE